MKYLTPITLVCIVQLGSLNQEYDFSSKNLTLFDRNVSSKYTDDELKKTAYLRLNSNKLTNSDTLIGLSAFPNIRYLDLSKNIIESLGSSLSNCKELTSLNLTENRIREVGSWFVSNSKLKVLNLEQNNLTSVKKASFSNLKSLGIIYLSYNQIRTVESRSFVDLPELIEIVLNHNQLTSVLGASFGNLPILTAVNLNDNYISELADNSFDRVKQDCRVSLQRNQIKYLSDIDGVSRTSIWLELQGNPICDSDKNVSLKTKPQQENLQDTYIPGPWKYYRNHRLSLDKCTN
ncbi:Uncharacterised protein g526 [Pycnogonum litorale]